MDHTLWEIMVPVRGESRTVTENERDMIISLYRDGLSMTQIGEQTNRPYGTIHSILHKAQDHGDIVIRDPGKRPGYDYTAIVRLWQEGKTARQITEALGCSRATINNALRQSRDRGEIRRRRPGGLTDHQQINGLLQGGQSVRDVAETVGCSRSTVYRVLTQGDNMAETATIRRDHPTFVEDARWRADVPARFHDLPDLITMEDMEKIFGYSSAYLRRLRCKRLRLEEAGNHDVCINALPPDFRVEGRAISRRPVLWQASRVIQWGIRTGRLDMVTGEPQRLWGKRKDPASAPTQ